MPTQSSDKYPAVTYDDCIDFLQAKLPTDPKWMEFGLLMLDNLIQQGNLVLWGDESLALLSGIGQIQVFRYDKIPGQRLTLRTRTCIAEYIAPHAKEVLAALVEWFSTEYVNRFNQKVAEWKA